MKRCVQRTRRHFLKASLTVAGLSAVPPARGVAAATHLDDFFLRKMETDQIPGVAAAVVRGDRMVWSGAYGWADLERRIPMSIDHLQNIGSNSKTFTTTALMQLWEQNRFELDEPVDDYLPFPIRNPRYPQLPITFRHLLTHQSSIRDGMAYGLNYACGDPKMPLGKWIREYLVPGGSLFSETENYYQWAPEAGWEYCNVAYGLLAFLVETLSGVDFAEYCQTHIFTPLQMQETSWYLRGIDSSKHALPYTYFQNGEARGPSWGGVPLGVVGRNREEWPQQGYLASCLYNHPNYPDGFLRCSVRQICNYLLAYLNKGSRNGFQLVQPATLRQMLAKQLQHGERLQGLTWYAQKSDAHEPYWGHGGSDPGINTDVRLRMSDKTGAVAFMNTNGVNPGEFTDRLMAEEEK